MTLYEKFLKQPAYTVLLILLLVFAGGWALFKMPIEFFPGLNYPLVNIITQYPGVSPEDVELLITRPIEGEVQAIRGVRRTSSISAMGVSRVTVEFGQGYDLLAARQFISAALSRIGGRLPQGVHPSIDNLGSRMQQIVGYTLVNTSIPQSRLRQIAEFHLIPVLHSIPGVSRIDVMGGQRPAFVVEPDVARLKQLGIGLLRLKQLLLASNVNVSGRYLEENHLDIPIRGNGQVQTLDALRFIRVKSQPDGAPIFLKDVAAIRKGHIPEHYLIRSNGRPAVAILVQKAIGTSATAIAKKVDEKMRALSSLLPPGTRVNKFYDQSEILNESMAGVKNEMWMGAILAIFVLFVFLRRLYPTFVVSLTIPLALLSAAVLMLLSGYSLNMMTLAALTLSIGMVVDDSIIVMENIERHQALGRPIHQAVLDGTRQILGPDVSGTITTVIVFLPLLFLTGFLRELILPFGMTISYTLLASLILSLTVIPVLMQRHPKRVIRKNEMPAFLRKFIRWNDGFFHAAMNHKKGLLGGLAAAFAGFLMLVLLLNPVGFLPPIDEGTLLIEYVMPPGVSLKESYRVGRQLSREALTFPDVKNVYLKIGSPENTYSIEGVNRGELQMKLVDKSRRKYSANALLEQFRQKFSGIEGIVCLYHQPTQENIDESFSGLPAFFGISIEGDNLDSLVILSKRVEKAADATPGIKRLINNAKFQVPQIEVVPRRPQLAYFGLTAEDVLGQMALAFRGQVVSYFIRGQAPVAIFLRLPKRERQNLTDLKTFPIQVGAHRTVPLNQLAAIGFQNTMPAITHLNSQREVTLVSGISGNIFAVIKKLKKNLSQIHFPTGYAYEIRGQYQTLLQSVRQFGVVILGAILLVYIILYLQFHSFWQPFVILLKIPLDFIGVFIALLLTRQALNLSVAIGLLTLVGVAVNNAIVLIDLANKLQETEKMLPREALLEAVHIRTRPILMTGLTTIFGLLPAAIGMGIGSEIHQPFAITIIGGMITGIFFSLNVVPALYEGIGKLAAKIG
ncbi:nickel and cobalt resistance protein CnrA [bacterium BMS3Bbin03]|nr:nickel and cobalt resistance protein CnrA [bacterium BMS3Bbin03]